MVLVVTNTGGVVPGRGSTHGVQVIQGEGLVSWRQHGSGRTRTRIHSVPTVVLLMFGARWVTPVTERWAGLVREKRNGWQGTRNNPARTGKWRGSSCFSWPDQGSSRRIESTVGTLWIRVLSALTLILPHNLDSMCA